MPNVTVNPYVGHGKACIAGTRIPVHIILSLLASGESIQGVLEAYPNLKKKHVLACIDYAAKLATEETVNEYKRK